MPACLLCVRACLPALRLVIPNYLPIYLPADLPADIETNIQTDQHSDLPCNIICIMLNRIARQSGRMTESQLAKSPLNQVLSSVWSEGVSSYLLYYLQNNFDLNYNLFV
jgi:hypothetical protein